MLSFIPRLVLILFFFRVKIAGNCKPPNTLAFNSHSYLLLSFSELFPMLRRKLSEILSSQWTRMKHGNIIFSKTIRCYSAALLLDRIKMINSLDKSGDLRGAAYTLPWESPVASALGTTVLTCFISCPIEQSYLDRRSKIPKLCLPGKYTVSVDRHLEKSSFSDIFFFFFTFHVLSLPLKGLSSGMQRQKSPSMKREEKVKKTSSSEAKPRKSGTSAASQNGQAKVKCAQGQHSKINFVLPY